LPTYSSSRPARYLVLCAGYWPRPSPTLIQERSGYPVWTVGRHDTQPTRAGKSGRGWARKSFRGRLGSSCPPLRPSLGRVLPSGPILPSFPLSASSFVARRCAGEQANYGRHTSKDTSSTVFHMYVGYICRRHGMEDYKAGRGVGRSGSPNRSSDVRCSRKRLSALLYAPHRAAQLSVIEASRSTGEDVGPGTMWSGRQDRSSWSLLYEEDR